jgi:hypothetical protein
MDIQFLLCGLIGLSFLYLPFSLVFYCCLFFLYSTSLPLSSEALMEESKQKMRNSFKPMVHLFSTDVRIILIVFFAFMEKSFFPFDINTSTGLIEKKERKDNIKIYYIWILFTAIKFFISACLCLPLSLILCYFIPFAF